MMNWRTTMIRRYVIGGKFEQEFAADIFLCNWQDVIVRTDGHTYLGHTLSSKGDHWSLVVRARKRNGKRIVKFITASTPVSCIIKFNMSLRRTGSEKWVDDKYAKKI